MLKLYRRIRRKLIEEGNLKRYLIYTIGEITLVVIGILIALQINDWNAQRLQKKLGQSYLHALHSDLLHNNSLIDYAIEQMEGTKYSSRSLAIFIDSGFTVSGKNKPQIRLDDEYLKTYNDHPNDYVPVYDTISLIHNLNRSGFVTSYSLVLPTWNEIISSGNIQLITNNTIKEEIVMLHFLADELKELETQIMIPIVKDYKSIRAKYYDVSKSSSTPKGTIEYGLFNDDDLIDINSLRRQSEVKYHLRRVYRAANEQQQNIEVLIRLKSNQIIQLIEFEFKKTIEKESK